MFILHPVTLLERLRRLSVEMRDPLRVLEAAGWLRPAERLGVRGKPRSDAAEEGKGYHTHTARDAKEDAALHLSQNDYGFFA